MELRPYQCQAVEAVYDFLRTRDDNPCVVIPTAGGKTPVMATICRDAVQLWQGRVLILAHVKELLEQAAEKLHIVAPDLPLGVYSAGLKRRDLGYAVTIAGIQSIYERACDVGHVDLVIVDEAHLIPPDGEGMYRTFLTKAKQINPLLRVIGMTATPFRMKSGTICSPENILNAICFEIGVRELIVQGYLCALRTKAGTLKPETKKLHVRGGEYVAGEVEDLMDDDNLVISACREIVEHTQNRNSVLIFASGVRHGQHICRVMTERHKAECGFVCGETLPFERDEALRRFRAGDLKYLCNVNVLTTGFDAPNIDCVALVRPTLSPGLYYQMVGRGFRLHPGKTDCIAEGQRVLTDCGFVPIEQVTSDMRVWDGINFVCHCGAVCQGEREVISYGGITATRDHKVWTQEGWKTLRQCAIEQTPICVTGIDGAPVQESNRCFRRGRSHRTSWSPTSRRQVRHLRTAVLEVLHQPDARHGGLSKMRPTAAGPEVACTASIGGQGSLHEHSQPALFRLRRPWNRVPVQHAHRNGGLDSRESGAASQPANRSNQQRRALRAGQPAVRHSEAEHAQPPPTTQRMRVWDLLNAGPRHRFTCEGLLVSNCKVLDFGGNVLRHGPVDQIRLSESGSNGNGEAPAKECPECHEIIAAGYAACPQCGYVFPPPQRQRHDATASSEGILSDQMTRAEHEVADVFYAVHVKRDAPPDAPRTMRVDYRVAFNEYVSEWVCFEHSGYARHRAEQWWRARSNEPVPGTVEEAVELAEAGALAQTVSVTVQRKPGEKYDRVVGYKLDTKPPRLDSEEGLPEYLPAQAGVPVEDQECPF